jgi:dienelactone hydrolase
MKIKKSKYHLLQLLIYIILSGTIISCTTSRQLSETEINNLLKEQLATYFSMPAEQQRNDKEFWKILTTPSKPQVSTWQKMIFSAAKREAVKAGKQAQFNQRVMIFNNPFGLDEKCPMQFSITTKGDKPKKGWPVYINIHGSGPVDIEYKIHQKRHKFYSGMLVVPRSPNDVTTTPTGKKGGIWRHWYIPAIEQLVTELAMFADADPDRIYLMGFSEGGYFSYRVIPEMSDRLAGVAPAAGGGIGDHNWVDNLVNTPFYAQSGENDNGYSRAETFREMIKSVQKAKKKYPGRINCRLTEYKGYGHQIPDTRKENSAPLWLEKFRRNPYPDLLIWQQKKDPECYLWRREKKGFTFPYISKSHYWVKVDKIMSGKEYSRVEATYKNNIIHLKSDDYNRITVRLNDQMVNLDKPVTIYFNNKKVYEAIPERSLITMIKTWEERNDPAFIFPAEVTVSSQDHNKK